MALHDQPLTTRRFVFAACAAATRSQLSATQRAAIIMALHDPQWEPRREDLPGTWGVVEAWYAGVQGKQPSAATSMPR